MGTRFKNFVATGVAPNGRLYAGDLLQMQDSYADQSNFSQVVGVGSLQVGDTSLILLKYGTGEFRLTGALRVDGILRGLGGLYAGNFTTTQRDAIGAGLAPTGLIIFNTTTGSFQWNAGTDGSRVWQELSGDLTLIPSAGQKAALAGTSGTPGSGNKYVTDADPRVGALSGDLSGTLPSPVVKKASQDFALSGDLTPPALTGDVNDYSPTNLGTASTLRLDATVDAAITGLAGGADGRIIVIHNISTSKKIILRHESGSSSATNRFNLPGNADSVFGLGELAALQYDSTSQRWRVVARSALPVFIGASVYTTVTQNLTGGGTLTVAFGGEDYDSSGFHAPNDTKIVIPAGLGGFYQAQVFGSARSDNAGTAICIRKNGNDSLLLCVSDTGENGYLPDGNFGRREETICPFVAMVPGDYIEMRFLTGEPGAVVYARSGSMVASGCHMTLMKVG